MQKSGAYKGNSMLRRSEYMLTLGYSLTGPMCTITDRAEGPMDSQGLSEVSCPAKAEVD
jgi:hypothetical protein